MRQSWVDRWEELTGVRPKGFKAWKRVNCCATKAFMGRGIRHDAMSASSRKFKARTWKTFAGVIINPPEAGD